MAYGFIEALGASGFCLPWSPSVLGQTKKPRVKLNQLLSETKHCIVYSANRVTCNACMNSFSTTDSACKSFLQNECVPIATPRFSHIQLDNSSPLHIGNQTIHCSHNIFKYRGLVYCLKCGSVGTKQIRLLAKQCEPPNNSRKFTLSNILAGKLPYGLVKWPDE